MAVHYALTGQWPDDVSEIQDPFWRTAGELWFSDIPDAQNAAISEGTLVVRLTTPFEGGIVSLRPAVPKADPLGPVVWFAGRPIDDTPWLISGPDHTNVADQFIHPQLR
ncbi:MAG: hypothetical protein HKP58_16130 [Desulfatitalea sp.]|nr:hypothetical protein [Desulfatitalea sp.]NNK01941.1 hypothetical protein [Desulfatitalea sp.]